MKVILSKAVCDTIHEQHRKAEKVAWIIVALLVAPLVAWIVSWLFAGLSVCTVIAAVSTQIKNDHVVGTKEIRVRSH